jgi:hypothetical protein
MGITPFIAWSPGGEADSGLDFEIDAVVTLTPDSILKSSWLLR